MKPDTYFLKNGEIYGVSRGDARTTYALKFTTWSDALTWLFTEEYDFRERELVSKTKAKQYGYKED